MGSLSVDTDHFYFLEGFHHRIKGYQIEIEEEYRQTFQKGIDAASRHLELSCVNSPHHKHDISKSRLEAAQLAVATANSEADKLRVDNQRLRDIVNELAKAHAGGGFIQLNTDLAEQLAALSSTEARRK